MVTTVTSLARLLSHCSYHKPLVRPLPYWSDRCHIGTDRYPIGRDCYPIGHHCFSIYSHRFPIDPTFTPLYRPLSNKSGLLPHSLTVSRFDTTVTVLIMIVTPLVQPLLHCSDRYFLWSDPISQNLNTICLDHYPIDIDRYPIDSYYSICPIIIPLVLTVTPSVMTITLPTVTPLFPATLLVPTVTPLFSAVTLLVPTVTPFVQTVTPLVPTGTPLVPTGTPLVTNVTCLVPTGTPSFTNVTPMSQLLYHWSTVTRVVPTVASLVLAVIPFSVHKPIGLTVSYWYDLYPIGCDSFPIGQEYNPLGHHCYPIDSDRFLFESARYPIDPIGHNRDPIKLRPWGIKGAQVNFLPSLSPAAKSFNLYNVFI